MTASRSPIRPLGREEGDDESDDGSRPPPEPRVPAPSSSDGAAWATQKATEAKGTALRAITVATDSLTTAKRIEERQIAHEQLFASTMGTSPDPVRKVPGTGLLGGVAEILDEMKTIKAERVTMDAAAVAVAAAKAKGREQWGTLGRGGVALIGIAATVIGIVKALGGGH